MGRRRSGGAYPAGVLRGGRPRAHIRYLLDEVFCDPRYIRVDGKPVFAVYRSALFPDMRRTIEVWREEAAARGTELYLCRVESFNASGREHLEAGFDAAIEFQPFTPAMTDYWAHRRGGRSSCTTCARCGATAARCARSITTLMWRTV